MWAFIRISVGTALAVSLGFIWTVGQSGLAQTNQHLCELWAQLPLPPYQSCEFQNVLVYIWGAAAFLGIVWVIVEIIWARQVIIGIVRMIEPHHVIVFGLIVALIGVIWQWRHDRQLATPTAGVDATTNVAAGSATPSEIHDFAWDGHLGHTYSGPPEALVTKAIQISAVNKSGRKIQLQDAFLNSDDSGSRKPLLINQGTDWIPPASARPIEPNKQVTFRAEFDLPSAEFYKQWKAMTLTLRYDDLPHKRAITEPMVENLFRSFKPNPLQADTTPNAPQAQKACYDDAEIGLMITALREMDGIIAAKSQPAMRVMEQYLAKWGSPLDQNPREWIENLSEARKQQQDGLDQIRQLVASGTNRSFYDELNPTVDDPKSGNFETGRAVDFILDALRELSKSNHQLTIHKILQPYYYPWLEHFKDYRSWVYDSTDRIRRKIAELRTIKQ